MASLLPDVAREERAAIPLPLGWVGMRGIATQLRLNDGATLAATAEIAVDLPDPHAKGIHMSRLYLLLDELSMRERLTPRALQGLLRQMCESHADCGSRAARVVLDFALLHKRPALVTPSLAGWKSYPVNLTAELRDGATRLTLMVRVSYSSTCPCSAALSRQALRDAFAADFSEHAQIPRQAALDWISARASLATPHSQRSEAEISIALEPRADMLPLLALIDTAEQALGTPVQTAVRRADEQAFALRNGANLMYVEDAARRLRLELEARFGSCAIRLSHFESLHAHDAIASAATPGWDAAPR
ncbi:MAG: GTP cyclohydrolase FolE2 [Herbaspirillum frisingense]|uniref:GTP cyclohydrolase FolE2 n=1 Tax=Herbaspirillum frisingense TaxID=92645 RepID=A0A7V8FW11_9BURK|nr:MAG: GTP cyclohydrolase FolE2 [Herbaspirillum frisingense]